jgi:hypothetical protein
MRKGILITMFAAWSAAAQTQIDLRTQAKSVDFTAAGSTKPLKTGSTLPAACAMGELFFNTSAAAGSNLFACTAPNTWSLEGSNGTAIENSGTIVGSRGTIDVIPGQGLTSIVTDTGSQINLQLGLDTAVVATRPGEQSGASLLCASSGGMSGAYRCSLNPTAAAYVIGMTLHWIPDVSGAGGPTTLNVDSLGAVPVKMADGATDPNASAIGAGQLYSIWYDGSRFRLPPSGTAIPGATSFELHLPLGICTPGSSSTLLWSLPPNGVSAATAGGCNGTNVNDAFAVFPNSGGSSLQFSVILPQTLTGTAGVYLSYLTGTASGTFTPAVDVVCTPTVGTAANDPPFIANNFFAPGSTTAPASANALQTISAGGLVWPSGCTAGQRAHFRLIRTDTGGSAQSVGITEVVVVGMRSL